MLKVAVGHNGPDTPMGPCRPHRPPPEIMHMIFAHITFDTATLKACAATCSAWYGAATPYLHHTLTIRGWTVWDARYKRLNPLAPLDKLGLLPLVKRVQFEKALYPAAPWFVPSIFDPEGMRHFGALVNLQDLAIADLHFSNFPAGVGEYFGHFSPRLRSVALSAPSGTRRQLLDFLMLFPKLDDIKISHYCAETETETREGLPHLAPFTSGGLRGRLSLTHFGCKELLKDIIIVFGGIRFTSVDLRNAQGTPLVLKACADTLETLSMWLDDVSQPQRMIPEMTSLQRREIRKRLKSVSQHLG